MKTSGDSLCGSNTRESLAKIIHSNPAKIIALSEKTKVFVEIQFRFKATKTGYTVPGIVQSVIESLTLFECKILQVLTTEFLALLNN